MGNENRIRTMTGFKKRANNRFVTSSQLIGENWNINGNWNFSNPVSAADPVDPQNLVTLNYFNTHAGLYQGVLDASAGIPYPAASEGMYWRISVAGVIGTTQVEIGDQVTCIAAYTGGMDDTKFMITQTNTQITDVTYAQLMVLMNDSKLEPGRKYRVTDFKQSYNVFDAGTNVVIEEQLGALEPLVITATGYDTIDRVVTSIVHPYDIIYYDPYGNNVLNDVGYSNGAGTLNLNFKGVIEFRHDTLKNVSSWYDFRNIKFRRWTIDANLYGALSPYIPKDICKSAVDGKIYKCIVATTGEGDPTVNTSDWILWLDITTNAYISWTSDKTLFISGDITTTNLILTLATYQDVYTFGSWYQHVHDVIIGKNDLIYTTNNNYKSSLNNIVFNTIDDLSTCHTNIIGDYNTRNTIQTGFYFNKTGNDFSSNVIGNFFGRNIIESSFLSNVVGNDVGNNFFGSNFGLNVIGSSINSNIFGNEIISSNIGDTFVFNTIGNSLILLIGNNCQGVSIGDFNNTIVLGNDCTGISIGERNGTIILGATNTDISIGNGNTSITTGDGCNGVTIHNDNSVVLGINANGVQIGDGNAISGTNNTLVAFRCESRNTLVLADGLLGIQIGNNNTITASANWHNVTFENGINFTTNTNVGAMKNVRFENAVGITGTNFAAATHIIGGYNKVVFMNATPEAKLFYFDALNALTVDNVNA